MKKMNLSLSLTYALFFIFSNLCAQNDVASFVNHLKTTKNKVKDIIPLVNEATKEVTIFIVDPKNIYAYKLDPNFKVAAKVSTENKKRKFKVLLGSDLGDKDYRLFLSNKSQTKFAHVHFSLQDQQTSFKEFSLEEGDEFIQSIQHKNKFYILAVNRASASILLYEFNEELKAMTWHEIDQKNQYLTNTLGNKSTIVDLMTTHNFGSILKFVKDTPNTIESVSNLVKMYKKGDTVLLTFDQNADKTQVISFGLTTKEVVKHTFDKPLRNIKSSRKKTNSFLYEDKIAIAAADSKVFSMYILDYPSGKFRKEYAVAKTEEIQFKNSPIVQLGGAYAHYRDLKKTSRFLRKITAENFGISIIKNENKYQFTIGGYVERMSGGMAMMGFGAIPIGGIGAVTFYFNPTMFAYNSFKRTKSTEIQCIFDSNFEHLENEEVADNIFDRIKSQKLYGDNIESIFKYDDSYMQGIYDKKKNTYTLKRFRN